MRYTAEVSSRGEKAPANRGIREAPDPEANNKIIKHETIKIIFNIFPALTFGPIDASSYLIYLSVFY